MNKGKRENETIINGSRVFVEDGEVKEILSEKIQRAGGLTIEEAYELICAAIDKVYDMDDM